jgi:hypothetical protein
LSPESQFCNLKEALPQSQCRNFKEMLLRNSATIFLMSATLSPQLETFISAIFGIFLAVESGGVHETKSEVKNLMQRPFKASFWFPDKQTVLKILLVDF